MPIAPNILRFFARQVRTSSTLRFFCKCLCYCYLRLLFFTYRLEVLSDSSNIPLCNQEGIFYFWHQDLIAAMFFFYKKGGLGYCMISGSNDGKIVGFLARRLGFKTIETSKNHLSVVREVLDVLAVNKRLCMVGDGSRGPAFELQPVITYLSEKSGLPLIFVECRAASACMIEKSWTKLQVPFPFSKIRVHVHVPVHPSSNSASCSSR